MLKKTKKSPNIGGDYPPLLQDWGGGHVPPVPPRGAAYVHNVSRSAEYHRLARVKTFKVIFANHASHYLSVYSFHEG